MKKGRVIVGSLMVVGIFLVLLLFLLAFDASAPSQLMTCLHCVEVGMTTSEVEAMFGRPPTTIIPLGDGSDLYAWFGRNNDNRASVVIKGGRVTGKGWAPSDETTVESIQNGLGMPWWGGIDKDLLTDIRERGKAAGPTTYKLDDPRLEAVFPGKPTVKIHPDGMQVTLEPVGNRMIFLLDINKLPAQVAVIDDPALAKGLLDRSVDAMQDRMKNAKLVSERDFLSNEKYPARAVDLERPGQWSYRWHFIVTPKYSYELAVGGTREFMTSDDANRFLNSFKIFE
jgi:hypothetical protein